MFDVEYLCSHYIRADLLTISYIDIVHYYQKEVLY
jgi:hypothetical protein